MKQNVSFFGLIGKNRVKLKKDGVCFFLMNDGRYDC